MGREVGEGEKWEKKEKRRKRVEERKRENEWEGREREGERGGERERNERMLRERERKRRRRNCEVRGVKSQDLKSRKRYTVSTTVSAFFHKTQISCPHQTSPPTNLAANKTHKHSVTQAQAQ